MQVFSIISCLLSSSKIIYYSSYTAASPLGNWTVASNWSNNSIPPALLPSYDTIAIRSAVGDSCVLNTFQTMSPGRSLVIAPCANFIVRQAVAINNLGSDSTFTDPGDSQLYTLRHIGTQVWMTKI